MNRTDINPAAWGRPTWTFLDAVIASYPERALLQDKTWMIEFLAVLGDALPCAVCRRSYKTWMRLHPIQDHMDTKKDVNDWLMAYKEWSLSNKSWN